MYWFYVSLGGKERHAFKHLSVSIVDTKPNVLILYSLYSKTPIFQFTRSSWPIKKFIFESNMDFRHHNLDCPSTVDGH